MKKLATSPSLYTSRCFQRLPHQRRSRKSVRAANRRGSAPAKPGLSMSSHTRFSSRGGALESGNRLRSEPEAVDRDGVQAVQEPEHVLLPRRPFEPLPVDPRMVLGDEQRPVDDVPQGDLCRGVPQIHIVSVRRAGLRPSGERKAPP